MSVDTFSAVYIMLFELVMCGGVALCLTGYVLNRKWSNGEEVKNRKESNLTDKDNHAEYNEKHIY